MKACQRGYVLLAVVLLTALVVTSIATYARHAIMATDSSQATSLVAGSRVAAESGVAWARQRLQSGATLGTSTIVAGDTSVTVNLTDLGSSHRALSVDAVDDDVGTTVLGEALLVPQTGGTLPMLTPAAVSAAKKDPQVQVVTGSATWQDLVFDGTLVLGDAASLTLRNVVIKGSIVSQPALDGPPYKAGSATSLRIEGGLRLEPSATLPGAAILMPEGVVVSASDSSVEIHGAILAKALTLAGLGSVEGNIATTTPATIAAAIDRPGQGRAPPAWPACLSFSTHALGWLAFPSPGAAAAETQAIKDFAFP